MPSQREPQETEAHVTRVSCAVRACREQLEAIADVVRSHPRLLVLSDEIYEYIIYK
jgi:hypothetical protein